MMLCLWGLKRTKPSWETRDAPETKGSVPYLLDVQSDLLDSLATRVVIPNRAGDYWSGADIASDKPVKHRPIRHP